MFLVNAYFVYLPIMLVVGARIKQNFDEITSSTVDIFDLTHPTTWEHLSEFYTAVEKQWKICVKCGVPGLGTATHLEHLTTAGSMKPAVIPPEYLVARLVIIDVSAVAQTDPGLALTVDVALQWTPLKKDPQEPTLLLFKFGWQRANDVKRQCICKIPGLSYELAQWISSNMSHVVGVATDAPTLESEQTREHVVRTVSNLLGRNGIYIIENVNLRKSVPEIGCLVIAMPTKLLEASYVPARVTAFCPKLKTSLGAEDDHPDQKSRLYDVNFYEIFN